MAWTVKHHLRNPQMALEGPLSGKFKFPALGLLLACSWPALALLPKRGETSYNLLESWAFWPRPASLYLHARIFPVFAGFAGGGWVETGSNRAASSAMESGLCGRLRQVDGGFAARSTGTVPHGLVISVAIVSACRAIPSPNTTRCGGNHESNRRIDCATEELHRLTDQGRPRKRRAVGQKPRASTPTVSMLLAPCLDGCIGGG
jgi:hypothetical protein